MIFESSAEAALLLRERWSFDPSQHRRLILKPDGLMLFQVRLLMQDRT